MTASHEQAEALARKLCRADGNDDPDLQVTFQHPMYASGLASKYRVIDPDGMFAPLWHVYYRLAEKAIEHTQEGTQ